MIDDLRSCCLILLHVMLLPKRTDIENDIVWSERYTYVFVFSVLSLNNADRIVLALDARRRKRSFKIITANRRSDPNKSTPSAPSWFGASSIATRPTLTNLWSQQSRKEPTHTLQANFGRSLLGTPQWPYINHGTICSTLSRARTHTHKLCCPLAAIIRAPLTQSIRNPLKTVEPANTTFIFMNLIFYHKLLFLFTPPNPTIYMPTTVTYRICSWIKNFIQLQTWHP